VRLVLNASAAVAVIFNRPASRHLEEALEAADLVLAPDLLVPELVNAIWKYHRFEGLSIDVCDRALGRAVSMADILVPSKELARAAFLLARTTARSAYDMFYLALAQREDASLLTLDASLRKEAQRQGVSVL
jgi:predicted nucleic acid-binding protein